MNQNTGDFSLLRDGMPEQTEAYHDKNLSRPRYFAAGRIRQLEIVLLVFLFALGLGLRLINLKTPPLDFHPTRQLRAAIISRGMYYQSLPNADGKQREIALQAWATMERYEPPILEYMVALTYRLLGSEQLWVARVYSSLFWMIGGGALYALARRIFSTGGALFALGFYLILPWGVLASRVFQPDPWMVMWVLLAAYALYRWVESGLTSWMWTVLAGLFSGLSILIKAQAFFPVAGMALFLLLERLFEREPLIKKINGMLTRPQLWVYAGMAGIIPGIYYIGLGDRSAGFASFWIFSFSALLLDHKFYIHWLGLISGIMDVIVFFAAIMGTFLFPRRARALIWGLWLGYFLIGITFPFQIYTHDYYSLILVPITAISLASFADAVVARLRVQPDISKIAFVVALLVISGYYAWVARSQVVVTGFYNRETIPWQQMGHDLPQTGSMIALTHDYGNRLKYYGWRMVTRLWPSQGDIELSAAAGSQRIGDFVPYFKEQTAGMDYFLVTLFGDLNNQPDLKAMLYDHYPIYQQGDGYVLFDLRHPKP
jgi:hypothetical protein